MQKAVKGFEEGLGENLKPGTAVVLAIVPEGDHLAAEMVLLDSPELVDRALLLRRWGRRSELTFFGSKKGERTFFSDLDGMEYDDLFIFDNVTYAGAGGSYRQSLGPGALIWNLNLVALPVGMRDFSGNGLFIDEAGNVGISTTTPQYKLDVQTDSFTSIRGTSTGGNNAFIGQ